MPHSSPKTPGKRLVLRSCARTKGAALVEYAMVAGLIGVGAVASVWATGTEVKTVFCVAADAVQDGMATAGVAPENNTNCTADATPPGTLPPEPSRENGVPVGGPAPNQDSRLIVNVLTPAHQTLDPGAQTLPVWNLETDVSGQARIAAEVVSTSGTSAPSFSYAHNASSWSALGTTFVSSGRPAIRINPGFSNPYADADMTVRITITSVNTPGLQEVRELRISRAAADAQLDLVMSHKGAEIGPEAHTITIPAGDAPEQTIFTLSGNPTGPFSTAITNGTSSSRIAADVSRDLSWWNTLTQSNYFSLDTVRYIRLTPTMGSIFTDQNVTRKFTFALQNAPHLTQERIVHFVRAATPVDLDLTVTHSRATLGTEVHSIAIPPGTEPTALGFTLSGLSNDQFSARLIPEGNTRPSTLESRSDYTTLFSKQEPQHYGTQPYLRNLRFTPILGHKFADQENLYRLVFTSQHNPSVVQEHMLKVTRAAIPLDLQFSVQHNRTVLSDSANTITIPPGQAFDKHLSLSFVKMPNDPVKVRVDNARTNQMLSVEYLAGGSNWFNLHYQNTVDLPDTRNIRLALPTTASIFTDTEHTYRITLTSSSVPSATYTQDVRVVREALPVQISGTFSLNGQDVTGTIPTITIPAGQQPTAIAFGLNIASNDTLRISIERDTTVSSTSNPEVVMNGKTSAFSTSSSGTQLASIPTQASFTPYISGSVTKGFENTYTIRLKSINDPDKSVFQTVRIVRPAS